MVLIVEDEAISRRALQQLLRLSGFETRAVSSAEEALSMVRHGRIPEMAIVDVNLPGMNGVEFVRQLHQSHPSLPCVFMTANDEVMNDQLRSQCPERTFRKPFDAACLLRLVLATVGVNPLH